MTSLVAAHGPGSLLPGPDRDNTATPEFTRHLAAASTAVRGEDYRILTTLSQPDLAADGGRLFEAATPEGEIVYRDGPDGSSEATAFGLLDPRTGTTTPLPAEVAQVGADRVITSRDYIIGTTRYEPGSSCGSTTGRPLGTGPLPV